MLYYFPQKTQVYDFKDPKILTIAETNIFLHKYDKFLTRLFAQASVVKY